MHFQLLSSLLLAKLHILVWSSVFSLICSFQSWLFLSWSHFYTVTTYFSPSLLLSFSFACEHHHNFLFSLFVVKDEDWIVRAKNVMQKLTKKLAQNAFKDEQNLWAPRSKNKQLCKHFNIDKTMMITTQNGAHGQTIHVMKCYLTFACEYVISFIHLFRSLTQFFFHF